MSVTASVILVLNNLGDVFGFAVQSEAVTKIVDSICGVLILFGVLTMSKPKEEITSEKQQIEEEKNNQDAQTLQSEQADLKERDINSIEPKNKE